MRAMKKKGEIMDMLSGAIMGVVTFAVICAMGLLFLVKLKENPSISADGNATAALTTSIEAIADVPSWIGIIVTVIVIVGIIGLLAYFGMRSKR